MKTTQIGVDVAKAVFEVAVSDEPGRVTERKRLTRGQMHRYFEKRPGAHVLLEACGSAHHWGRQLRSLGHQVSLLHPADVARYRDGNKTDRADAKALLEAARNDEIDAVPVKTEDQQAMAALHRIRQSYLRTRTARINAVRGHLREFGVVIPRGARCVVDRAKSALKLGVVPDYLCTAVDDLLEEIETLSAKASKIADLLKETAVHSPPVQQLITVPGVGVLTATALVAFVGDIHRFRSGRDFSAYLGLTPREFSSGTIRRQGRITKRGNSYLRMMLVHGARSALWAGKRSPAPDDLRTWALNLQARKGHNVAAVALANKLARVCWRVWRDQRPFERRAA
jgi:transposase